MAGLIKPGLCGFPLERGRGVSVQHDGNPPLPLRMPDASPPKRGIYQVLFLN
jgi:hypothetical protein